MYSLKKIFRFSVYLTSSIIGVPVTIIAVHEWLTNIPEIVQRKIKFSDRSLTILEDDC